MFYFLAFNAFQVFSSTIPVSAILFAFWNAFTDVNVRLPKSPSAFSLSNDCIFLTRSPLSPSLMGLNGSVASFLTTGLSTTAGFGADADGESVDPTLDRRGKFSSPT